MQRLQLIFFMFLISLTSLFAQPVKLKGLIPGLSQKKVVYSASYKNKLLVVLESNNYWQPSELWLTDGTIQNTVNFDKCTLPSNFLIINDTLYYTSIFTSYPYDFYLKRSDGTVAGTESIKTLSGSNNSPSNFIKVKNRFYFLYNEILYKSDGTSSGTLLVKDLTNLRVSTLLSLNDTLYFVSSGSKKNYFYGRLWKSDGTNAGTLPILNPDSVGFINTSMGPSNYYYYYSSGNSYTTANNIVYFAALDTIHGMELWRSDGTASGTYMLKDINPKVNAVNYLKNTSGSYPTNFISVNNEIFFSVKDTIGRSQLWKTDGTIAGTILVKNYCQSLSQCPAIFTEDKFVEVNNKILIKASFDKYGRELLVSDGTEKGTDVIEIRPGPMGGCDVITNSMVMSSGYLYFSANDGVSGYELWRTDGTSSGTGLVADIVPGTGWSNAQPLADINGVLYFVANDLVDSLQIWRVEGTSTVVTPSIPNSSVDGFKTIGSNEFGNLNTYFNNDDISIDHNDNTYISGAFVGGKINFFDDNNSILFDSTYYEYTYDRSLRTFLAKYDSSFKLKWVKAITHSPQYIYNFYSMSSVANDSHDNLFFACYADTKLKMDSVDYNIFGNGVMLFKFSPNGKEQWHKYFLKGNSATFQMMKIDKSDNLYMIGKVDYSNFYISKYDSQGVFQWEVKLKHEYNCELADVVLSKDGKVYVLTSESPDKFVGQCKSNSYNFIKITCISDASIDWTKSFPTENNIDASDIDINVFNELQISGTYSGDLKLDNFLLNSDCEHTSAFYARLNSRGDVVGTYSSYPNKEIPFNMACNSDGTFNEVGMKFNCARDYHSKPSTQFPSGANRLFVKKHDYLGGTLEEREFYKPDDNSSGYPYNPKMVLDSKGNYIVYDLNRYGLDTISNAIYTAPSSSLILMKVNKDLPNEYPIIKEDLVMVCPNPTTGQVFVRSDDESMFTYELSIVNSLGQKVMYVSKNDQLNYFETNISSLAKGMYFFVFQGKGKRVVKKVIKE